MAADADWRMKNYGITGVSAIFNFMEAQICYHTVDYATGCGGIRWITRRIVRSDDKVMNSEPKIYGCI